MNETFIRIIKSSKVLSERLKTLLIYTGEKKIKKDGYSYLSVGDAYSILRRCEALCEDLKSIQITDRIYCYLFYDILGYYCDFDINTYNELIESTFFDAEFQTAVLNTESSDSAFVSYMKVIAPKLKQLELLINNNQSIQVLRIYKEIIDLCNRYGIPSGLGDEMLKKELEKRFMINNPLINIKYYQRIVENPVFEKEDHYQQDGFICTKNHNNLLYSLQKKLYEKIFEYYQKTGCFFRQYSDSVNIYLVGEITIIAYKYDEVPDMALISGALTLTWKDRDFWAKIFDPNIDFVNDSKVSYFIDDPKNSEYYSVESLKFKKMLFMGSKLIFAPEEYIEEALVKYLTESGNLPFNNDADNQLRRYGFNPDNLTNKLMSADNCFFFKDPSLVDELTIKDINDFTYLGLIKLKTDKSSRNRCIASIRAASKKNPKKPEQPRKPNPYCTGIRKTYRMPYKDD